MSNLKRYRRRIIQLISLAGWLCVLYLIYRGILLVAHSFCPYSIICFSPYFAVNNLTLFLPAMAGGLLILISTLVFSRWFCGYLCLFGTIQEFLSLVKKRFKGLLKNKLYHIHGKLLIAKYLILTLTVIFALLLRNDLTSLFCPVMGLNSLQEIAFFSAVSLFIIFVIALFSERFWCNYLCPYAALMNLFIYLGRLVRLPRLRIHKNMETCVDCYRCNRVCPMAIDLVSVEVVNDPNCILCDRCIEECPKKMTLTKKINTNN